MMVWTYTSVLSVCLQLLTLLISVAVSGIAAATELVVPNYFLTLKRKARVLKIRALRALDSTGAAAGSAPAEDCAASRVAARPELWALIAPHLNLVETYRLKTVCRAAGEGATEGLRTLPGLVVSGGATTTYVGDVLTSDVWRLDLGELQWERMPSLTRGCALHACCAVRGGVVVLGGFVLGQGGRFVFSASEEILGCGSEARILAALGNYKIAPRLLPFFSDTRFLFSVTETYFCPLRTTTDASPSVYPNTPTPVCPCIRTPPRQRRHCCHRIHSKKKHSRHPSSPRQRQSSQLTSNVATQKTFSPPLLTASASNVTTQKFTPRHRCRAANFAHPSRDLTRLSAAAVVRPLDWLRRGCDRRERERPGPNAPSRRLGRGCRTIISGAQG
jgi:hypothetical protein